MDREVENVKPEIGPGSGVETSSGSGDVASLSEVGFGFLGRRAAL